MITISSNITKEYDTDFERLKRSDHLPSEKKKLLHDLNVASLEN